MIPFGIATHPSKIDLRDHKSDVALAGPLPDKYFVDESTLLMRMQYKIGKCVGAGNARRVDSLFNMVSSDDFIYLGAKLVDGDLKEGTSIRSALKFLQKTGVCKRSTFSILVNNLTTYADYIKNVAPQAAFDEAKNYKIGNYISCPINADLMKAYLVNHGPLVIRMEVGSEWWTSMSGKTSYDPKDILPLRKPKTIISGHCVELYGYDSTLVEGKTAFYIANSWSNAWADNGTGYFFFEDYQPTEAWAVTLDPVPDRSISVDVLLKFFNLLVRLGVRVASLAKSVFI